MSEAAVLEMKEQIDATYKTIEEFKTVNDEAIKKNTTDLGEYKEKTDKMLEDIVKTMEQYQDLEAKFKAIQSMPNFGANSKEDKEIEYKEKIKKAFNDFARTGLKEENFENFCLRTNVETKLLAVNDDANGGFVVIPEFGGILQTRFFETSRMRQLATIQPISSDSIDMILDDTESESGGFVGEEAPRVDTGNSTYKKKNIPTHEQYAQPKATQKILDDAIIDMERWVAEKTADILGRTENTRFVTGNGVVNPRGFMTYPAWASEGVYEANKIEQIVSGDAANFTADGIMDLQNSLIEEYQDGAVFVTKRANFKQIAKLKDGQGNYLFNRALDKNVGRPFDLLSQPVVFFNDIPAVAANSLSLAYGDFKRGYLIVDRIGIRTLRDPYTSKGFVKFYTTKRVGGDVVNFQAIKIQKISA